MSDDSTFENLLSQLLDGQLSASDRDVLAKLCGGNAMRTNRVRTELELTELLRQSTVTIPELNQRSSKGEPIFIQGVQKRIDGHAAGFDGLAEILLHREIDAADLEALALECHRDESKSHQLRNYLEHDDYLDQISAPGRSAESFVDGLITRMWAESEEDHFVEDFVPKIVELVNDRDHTVIPLPSRPRPQKRIPRRSRGIWAAAAACVTASLLTFFTVNMINGGNTSGDIATSDNAAVIVAHISESVGSVKWNSGAQPINDDAFSIGRYKLESGVIRVTFESGAEMTIDSPADFEIRSANETFIHSGLAMARVSDLAGDGTSEPFILQSKGVNLAEAGNAPGAVVGVDARDQNATEAIVFNGATEIELTELGKTRQLYDLEAVRADLENEKLYDIPYNPMAFGRVWELVAGVERNAGDVKLELPGSEVAPQAQASNGRESVQVFLENDSFIPSAKIEVDTLTPGRFASTRDTGGEALDRNGAPLRSYLLQLWPEGEAPRGNDPLEASVTFDHEIVGVIFSSDRLEQTDSLVGLQLTNVGGNVSQLRGLDSGGENGDQILLSDDRRTVNVRLRNGGADHMDHVRILVALR